MRTARQTSRGFGAFSKIAGRKSNLFRVEDDTRLIAFLEEENFGSANRHWIDIIDPETGKRRTTVKNCIKGIDERGCPLCKAGDTPKATAYFNVVDLEDPTAPLVWEATTEPFNKISKRYELRRKNDQNINDPDIFWAISKEANGQNGKGAKVYSVDPVKLRDLSEDWPSVSPLDDETRARLISEMATEEGYIKYPEYEHLEEVVSQLA